MDSFRSRSTLKIGSKEYEIFRLDALDKQSISTQHLPFSLRILLENLLRTEDGRNVKGEDIRALASWNSKTKSQKEIAFTPSRVLMQDFTGVSGYSGRHRFAHYDDQWSGSVGLGRGRNRSRSRHAGATCVHADPASSRREADRSPARRSDGNRSCSYDYRDVAQARRRWEIR